MLIRILNTLRSRIWDMVLFLFSDYPNPQLVRMGDCPEVTTLDSWLSVFSNTAAPDELMAAHRRTDIESTKEGTQHDLDIMNNPSTRE